MTESYRVLIIEDNRDLADLISTYLGVSGPFVVDQAATIRELWEHLDAHPYDILLMDYRLPGGNGLDAMREIKERGYRMPVVMMTGQGDERLAVQALQLGAVDYLVKGTNYLPSLPNVIATAIRTYRLERSVEESLDQIHYQALLLNNVRDAVVVWSTEGAITYWNPAAQRLYGWSPKERVGMPARDLYLNEFSPPIRIPPADATGGFEIERSFVNREGKTIWISSRVSVLRNSGARGRIIGYMDVSRDITARKRSEQALRSSEERYRAVSELISDFVYALRIKPDQSVSCEWVTDAFAKVTGYSPDEINWHEKCTLLFHPEDREQYDAIRLILQQNKADVREFRIVQKSGEVRWIRNYARPLYNSEGHFYRVFGACKDITERKEMEAHLHAAQVQLTQSARLAAIGELAAGVAHHINNPLTTIIADAQLLLQSLPQNHPGRESADAIESAGWRVQQIVQQLIEFSQQGANTFAEVSINQTIENALTLLGSYITSTGTCLDVQLDQGLPSLYGNDRQLSNLWVNLLILARNATADGQPHTIKVRSRRAAEDQVVVEVIDDGFTIPPGEIEHLFEPNFFKTLGGRGTGIELNICQEIVRQHHSLITAESHPEQGTVFRVHFPLEELNDVH